MSSSTNGAKWPSTRDYARAVQKPADYFVDRLFRRARFRTSASGIPVSAGGNNAIAFIADAGKNVHLLRCFVRPPGEGSEERYKALEALQATEPMPELARAVWISNGIRFEGQVFPVVRMEWIDALPLHRYIRDVADDREALQDLADHWLALCTRLREARLAHADLQTGNVLVEDGRPRLIDFDALWLPELADLTPGETGHRNFQHPQRREIRHWDEHVDAFSALSIYVSLRALAVDASLLELCSESNLIFRERDYLAPARTEPWFRVAASRDTEVRDLAALLARYCRTTVALETDLPTLLEQQTLPLDVPYASEAATNWPWWHGLELEDEELVPEVVDQPFAVQRAGRKLKTEDMVAIAVAAVIVLIIMIALLT